MTISTLKGLILVRQTHLSIDYLNNEEEENQK